MNTSIAWCNQILNEKRPEDDFGAAWWQNWDQTADAALGKSK
jgi:hypothetical protein